MKMLDLLITKEKDLLIHNRYVLTNWDDTKSELDIVSVDYKKDEVVVEFVADRKVQRMNLNYFLENAEFSKQFPKIMFIEGTISYKEYLKRFAGLMTNGGLLNFENNTEEKVFNKLKKSWIEFNKKISNETLDKLN